VATNGLNASAGRRTIEPRGGGFRRGDGLNLFRFCLQLVGRSFHPRIHAGLVHRAGARHGCGSGRREEGRHANTPAGPPITCAPSALSLKPSPSLSVCCKVASIMPSLDISVWRFHVFFCAASAHSCLPVSLPFSLQPALVRPDVVQSRPKSHSPCPSAQRFLRRWGRAIRPFTSAVNISMFCHRGLRYRRRRVDLVASSDRIGRTLAERRLAVLGFSTAKPLAATSPRAGVVRDAFPEELATGELATTDDSPSRHAAAFTAILQKSAFAPPGCASCVPLQTF